MNNNSYKKSDSTVDRNTGFCLYLKKKTTIKCTKEEPKIKTKS